RPHAPTAHLLGRAFLPLYLVLPVVAIVFLSWGKRDFAPRYLIFAAPAYYLLLGKGLSTLLCAARAPWKALGALALLLVMGSSSLSLYNYYYDPAYWRDDVRGMVEHINSRSRDGDAIVLNAYYLRPTFSYYYRGKASVVGLPDRMPADWDGALASLERIASQHNRVWLVLWQDYFTDPGGRIQGWLDETSYPFEEKRFQAPATVIGYNTKAPIVQGSMPGRPVGLKMGRTIELASHQFAPVPPCAGEEMPFTLYWRALRPVPVDYSVFVHLVDGEGKTWSTGDSQPAGGGFPTTYWPVGSLVADERRIQIPHDIPPGQYSLEVGMYDLNTMKRLGEGDPDPFQTALGPFEVRPVGCK
ncbi:MAG TPA: hypothetical protein VJO15_07980, partial [Dehalococcoidia bacterium]|nr:hypothetical protein [Dehalococcoidia bacterium]